MPQAQYDVLELAVAPRPVAGLRAVMAVAMAHEVQPEKRLLLTQANRDANT